MRFLPRLLAYYLLLTASLSLTRLPSFDQIVYASENATALSAPHFHRVRGDNKRLPATLTAWQEVDFAYERLFPYDHTRQPHPPAGCMVLPVVSHYSVTKILMLRCQERINLLRPAWWVTKRLRQQSLKGYLWLNLPEMGIQDVQAHIVAIRPSFVNPTALKLKSTLSRPVIGLFIRHTTDVRQYTFKDTTTGKLNRIKATPNHPFYVINQHRYIPVSHLSPHDRLVNVMGYPVTLVCPWGKSSHCGQPYHYGQVIRVYNLEVYGQHRYFVGEPGILVHNVYNCRTCKRPFTTKHTRDVHEITHTGDKPYPCDQCDRKFARSDALARHKKTHTKVKTHLCKVCNKFFFRKEHLNNHYLTMVHQRKLDELYAESSAGSGSDYSSETESASEGARSRSRSPLPSATFGPDPQVPKEDVIPYAPTITWSPEDFDFDYLEEIWNSADD